MYCIVQCIRWKGGGEGVRRVTNPGFKGCMIQSEKTLRKLNIKKSRFIVMYSTL